MLCRVALGTQIVEQRINSEVNREPHEAKKKSFDLGGIRTNDLRIRSTGTLPTVFQFFLVDTN